MQGKKRIWEKSAFLAAEVIVIVLLYAAVNSGGQAVQNGQRQQPLVSGKYFSRRAAEIILQAEAEIQENRPPDWIKPHKDGMIPVYGRDGIDYITFADFDLMSRVVYAEAETESFSGKVAVAEVILNRVESDTFPDTVAEVITQENAFSAYGASDAAPLDTECQEAVQEAVNGRIFPGEVVYFREGHFHTFGTPYAVIGNHYFSTE